MSHRVLLAIPFVLAVGGCNEGSAPEPTPSDGAQLEILTLDDTTLRGVYFSAGSLIQFHSESTDQQRAELRLVVNGTEFEVTLDLTAMTATQDGHMGALFEEDLAALVGLRDALADQYIDEVTSTLQGKLLSRHADRLAEAPVGFVHESRSFDLRALGEVKQQADADGCGEDGLSCFPGTSGSTVAVFDQGDGNAGYCHVRSTTYGGSGCPGRCGAGCNFLDNDYTWDCLDHDRCVGYYGGSVFWDNANCGDEFWEADDDYWATMGSLC